MAERWDERAIFLAARELGAADRDAFLRGACPDSACRERIEQLLRHCAPEPAVDRPASIREFRIIRELGRGGMGEVYLAHDELLGRSVALKLLSPRLTFSQQAITRFYNEAKAVASLNSPHIVQVHQFGEENGTHYIAMEYVEGPTFAQWLPRGAAPAQHTDSATTWTSDPASNAGATSDRAYFRSVAKVIEQVAAGLNVAHTHDPRIVHRDIKPSNILITTQGDAKITDFGIAKIISGEPVTEEGQTPGTPHYMSPEQAQAASDENEIDHRSDIFSLGVVLFEALTHRRPFDGATAHQVLHSIRTEEAPPVRSINRSVPRDLATICHKTLEKEPDDRYQSTAHLAGELRCFLEGRPILARPTPLARRLVRAARQRKSSILVGLLILLTLATAATLLQLERARLAGLVRVDIDTSGHECSTFIQNMSGASVYGPDSSQPERAGKRLLLEPGQYRVTLIRDRDGASAEFNLVLTETGPGSARRLIAIGPDDGWPELGERDLCSTLRAPEDLAGEMVRIDAGEYRLALAVPEGVPTKDTAFVDAFLIDAQEVTNKEYRLFLEATGRREPYHFRKLANIEAIDDLPVVFVTLEDAEAYARWRGKRLPTFVEWQAAARGTDGALYPNAQNTPPTPYQTPPPRLEIDLPAGDDLADSAVSALNRYVRNARPAATPAPWDPPGGLLHTHSNVRELTATLDAQRSDVVLAGRAWAHPIDSYTLRNVNLAPIQFGSSLNGFRCAKSLTTRDITMENTR